MVLFINDVMVGGVFGLVNYDFSLDVDIFINYIVLENEIFIFNELLNYIVIFVVDIEIG